jgi:hypothetical protein
MGILTWSRAREDPFVQRVKLEFQTGPLATNLLKILGLGYSILSPSLNCVGEWTYVLLGRTEVREEPLVLTSSLMLML